MLTFTYGERKIQAVLPLYSSPDETVTSSVKLLVSLFGQVIRVNFRLDELGIGIVSSREDVTVDHVALTWGGARYVVYL